MTTAGTAGATTEGASRTLAAQKSDEETTSPPDRVPRQRQTNRSIVPLTDLTDPSATSALTEPGCRLPAVWAPSLSEFWPAQLQVFGGMTWLYRDPYIVPRCQYAPTE